jgi:hypothetical protein
LLAAGSRNPPTLDRPDNAGDTNPHHADNRGPYAVVKWIIKT